MKILKKWWFWLITVVVIFILIIFLINPLHLFLYSIASPCYGWNIGGIFIDGVPYKQCVCEGKLIGSCPPGALCDKGSIRCLGKIIEFKYVYGSEDFDTLEQWENYCNSLKDKMKTFCLDALNKTKLAEK